MQREKTGDNMDQFHHLQSKLKCLVPENIHTPPTEGFWFATPPTP